MSEMSSGLRVLEMYERQSTFRARARKENEARTLDRPLPWKLRRRHAA